MANKTSSNGRLWVGAILVIVGILLFMRNFHFHIFSIDFFSWPFLAFVIGIILIFNSKESFFGLLLVVLGAIGLASNYLHIPFRSVLSEYWPFLLIILGIYSLYIAFVDNKSGKIETIEDNDYIIDIFSFLGEKIKVIKSNSILGGKVTTLISELHLNLRETNLSKPKTVLDTLTIFGSTRIFIPSDWEVVIKTTTVFGGFEDKRSKINNDTDSKILVIKGLVLFGGGEITT